MKLTLSSLGIAYEIPICNTVIRGDVGGTRLLYGLAEAICHQFEKCTIYICTRDPVSSAEEFASRFCTDAHKIEVLHLSDTPEFEIVGMGRALSHRRRLRVIDDVVFFLVDDFNFDVMLHPGSVAALSDWNISAEATKTFLYAATNKPLLDCTPSCQIEVCTEDHRAVVEVDGRTLTEFSYHM